MFLLLNLKDYYIEFLVEIKDLFENKELFKISIQTYNLNDTITFFYCFYLNKTS